LKDLLINVNAKFNKTLINKLFNYISINTNYKFIAVKFIWYLF